MLKARLRADLKVYADAIATLERRAISAGKDSKGFDKAHANVEHARLAYESARKKFEEHVASHGCGSL